MRGEGGQPGQGQSAPVGHTAGHARALAIDDGASGQHAQVFVAIEPERAEPIEARARRDQGQRDGNREFGAM